MATAAVLYLYAGVIVSMTLTRRARADINQVTKRNPFELTGSFALITALWPLMVYDDLTGGA